MSCRMASRRAIRKAPSRLKSSERPSKTTLSDKNSNDGCCTRGLLLSLRWRLSSLTHRKPPPSLLLLVPRSNRGAPSLADWAATKDFASKKRTSFVVVSREPSCRFVLLLRAAADRGDDDDDDDDPLLARRRPSLRGPTKSWVGSLVFW